MIDLKSLKTILSERVPEFEHAERSFRSSEIEDQNGVIIMRGRTLVAGLREDMAREIADYIVQYALLKGRLKVVDG